MPLLPSGPFKEEMTEFSWVSMTSQSNIFNEVEHNTLTSFPGGPAPPGRPSSPVSPYCQMGIKHNDQVCRSWVVQLITDQMLFIEHIPMVPGFLDLLLGPKTHCLSQALPSGIFRLKLKKTHPLVYHFKVYIFLQVIFWCMLIFLC